MKKDDEPKEAGKVSANKRLGWNLSKDAAVQADTTKQLKNIEAFLQKSEDIDVRKAAMKKTSRAGEGTKNPIQASALMVVQKWGKDGSADSQGAQVVLTPISRAGEAAAQAAETQDSSCGGGGGDGR